MHDQGLARGGDGGSRTPVRNVRSQTSFTGLVHSGMSADGVQMDKNRRPTYPPGLHRQDMSDDGQARTMTIRSARSGREAGDRGGRT